MQHLFKRRSPSLGVMFKAMNFFCSSIKDDMMCIVISEPAFTEFDAVQMSLISEKSKPKNTDRIQKVVGDESPDFNISEMIKCSFEK